MSSTDSCVVNAPRAGPICSAHSSTSEPSVLSVAFSSAASSLKIGQFSGLDVPCAALVEHEQVARGERRRDRRRELFAERVGGLPGPAGERDAPRSGSGSAPAALRSIVSAIVPGALPLRSSGTGSEAQEKPATFEHGANASAAPAGARRVAAQQAGGERHGERRRSAFAVTWRRTLAAAVVEGAVAGGMSPLLWATRPARAERRRAR